MSSKASNDGVVDEVSCVVRFIAIQRRWGFFSSPSWALEFASNLRNFNCILQLACILDLILIFYCYLFLILMLFEVIVFFFSISSLIILFHFIFISNLILFFSLIFFHHFLHFFNLIPNYYFFIYFCTRCDSYCFDCYLFWFLISYD